MAKKLTGVSEAAKPGAGSWDKLEQVFEERVARALGSMGAPTRAEVDALTRQVAELRQTVAALTEPAGRPAPKKAAPRKRAAGPSAP